MKKEGNPFPFIMIYSMTNGFVKVPSPDAYSISGFNDTDERAAFTSFTLL